MLPRMSAESPHSRIQYAEPARRDGINMRGRYIFAKPISERVMRRKRQTIHGRTELAGMIKYNTDKGGDGRDEEAENVT